MLLPIIPAFAGFPRAQGSPAAIAKPVTPVSRRFDISRKHVPKVALDGRDHMELAIVPRPADIGHA
jgi:hypothetical protein